jgi:hypothetical protein
MLIAIVLLGATKYSMVIGTRLLKVNSSAPRSGVVASGFHYLYPW